MSTADAGFSRQKNKRATCVAAYLILGVTKDFEVKINLTTRRVRFPVVLEHLAFAAQHAQPPHEAALPRSHVVNDMQRYVLQIPYYQVCHVPASSPQRAGFSSQPNSLLGRHRPTLKALSSIPVHHDNTESRCPCADIRATSQTALPMLTKLSVQRSGRTGTPVS